MVRKTTLGIGSQSARGQKIFQSWSLIARDSANSSIIIKARVRSIVNVFYLPFFYKMTTENESEKREAEREAIIEVTDSRKDTYNHRFL